MNKKVFIFRTCPLDKFQDVLNLVSSDLGEVEFTIFTSCGSGAVLSKLPDVASVIEYNESEISFFKFLNYLKIINKQRYDYLFIPYNHPAGIGYFSVELVALFVHAKQKRLILFDYSQHVFNWFFLLKKVSAYSLDGIVAYICFLLMLGISSFWRLLSHSRKSLPKNKVIFIAHRGEDHPSSRIRCWGFAKLLQAQGCEVEVVKINYAMDQEGSLESRFFSDSRKMLANLNLLLRLLKDKNSIIYLQKAEFHFIGPYLASRINNNSLIFDMDDWEEDFVYFARFPFLNNKQKVYAALAKQAKAFIVSSHYLEDHYSKLKADIVQIPSGIDLEKFPVVSRLASYDREIVICWLGGICDQLIVNNISFFCDILSQIEGRKIRFEIVGNGLYLPRLKNMLKLHYANLNVVMRDFMDYSQVPDYLNTVDIGICPLVDQTGVNLAKCPVKLLEYMASSLAVIASDLGEPKYILEDGKNGFLARDNHDWQEKLKCLVLDVDLRIKMGKAARKTIEERYDLNLFSEQLYEAVFSIDNRLETIDRGLDA